MIPGTKCFEIDGSEMVWIWTYLDELYLLMLLFQKNVDYCMYTEKDKGAQQVESTQKHKLLIGYKLQTDTCSLNGSKWDMLRFKDQGRVGHGYHVLPPAVQLLPCDAAAPLRLRFGARQRGLSILAKCWKDAWWCVMIIHWMFQHESQTAGSKLPLR